MPAYALNIGVSIGVTLSGKSSAKQHKGIVIGETWRKFECSPFLNFILVKKLIDISFWNVCLPDKYIQRTDKKWLQLFTALAICSPFVTKFKVMTFYCTDPNSTRRFCWAKNVKEVQSKTGKDHFILNYQYIQYIKYSLSTCAGY